MLQHKLGPYFLLTGLVVLLFFIIGVRYGQKVEKANKTINYLISLPPTKMPPTTAPLQFETYKHEGCGIQFLYPSSLKLSRESSDEAEFADGERVVLELNCNQTNRLIPSPAKTATEEIKLQNKKTIAYVKGDNIVFQLKNYLNYKTIFIAINRSLLPLFDSSLKYLPL